MSQEFIKNCKNPSGILNILPPTPPQKNIKKIIKTDNVNNQIRTSNSHHTNNTEGWARALRKPYRSTFISWTTFTTSNKIGIHAPMIELVKKKKKSSASSYNFLYEVQPNQTLSASLYIYIYILYIHVWNSTKAYMISSQTLMCK